MSRWWRAYDEAVDDPKLILLSDKAHRAWFSLMCTASANSGVLPEIKIIAVKLRTSPQRAAAVLTELVAAGLFDQRDDGAFEPHNWNARQYKTDVMDPTNATRQKRHREKLRNTVTAVTETVTAKRPETETETETETEKKDTPPGVSTYVFEDGIIRLNGRDFEVWRRSFSYLDLAAELLSLSKWAESEGTKWFHAVKGALAKRNREVKAAKEKLAADGGFKWNGIEGVI